MNHKRLESILSSFLEGDNPFHSRIHSLNSFPQGSFVKRDDELGFGVSGCKYRKYISLIPYLKKKGIEIAILKGGPYSNHLVSFAQKLIENQIRPKVFFPQKKVREIQGNLLMLKCLLGESDIHLTPSPVEEAINAYYKESISRGIPTEIIEEGASQKESLPGALTLPIDIMRNEETLNRSFSHLFTECGTGFTAHALILGMALLDPSKHIHCLLLAGTKQEFIDALNQRKKELEDLLQIEIPSLPSYFLYEPSTLKSFGSTNNELFAFITNLARQEGFFTDPIYSAKLFGHAYMLCQELPSPSNKLIIHSGGALTLMGFQKQIAKALSSPH